MRDSPLVSFSYVVRLLIACRTVQKFRNKAPKMADPREKTVDRARICGYM